MYKHFECSHPIVLYYLNNYKMYKHFECSHPIVLYYLNNYKIPVQTQHIISIMLYSHMFRLIMMTLMSRNMSL